MILFGKRKHVIFSAGIIMAAMALFSPVALFTNADSESSEAPINSSMSAYLSKSIDGNYVVSPVGIRNGIQSLVFGAEGETLKELELFLHASRIVGRHDNNSFESSVKEGIEYASMSLFLINSRGIRLGKTFLGKISESKQTEVFKMELSEDVYRLNDRMVEFYGEYHPDQYLAITGNSAMKIVILNKFFSEWEYAFNAPQSKVFYNADNSKSHVPTMKIRGNFLYHDAIAYKAIEIPYSNQDFAAIAILPNRKGAFTTDPIEIVKNFYINSVSSFVELSLPTFSINTNISLEPMMMYFGVNAPFDIQKANFSSMTDPYDNNFFLAYVKHEATIDVSEYGTVAASATEFGFIGSASDNALQDAIALRINRPFYFFVIHKPSMEILFLGHIKEMI